MSILILSGDRLWVEVGGGGGGAFGGGSGGGCEGTGGDRDRMNSVGASD